MNNNNAMDKAWMFLKGNPEMFDEEGRYISHPAAMVYNDIANQVAEDRFNPYYEDFDIDNTTASDEMSQLQNPNRAGSFERYAQEKRGINPSKSGVKLNPAEKKIRGDLSLRDSKDKEKARKIRQFARERTSQMMNEPDQSTGPNFGMRQSTGTDVRMKPGNIMDQV